MKSITKGEEARKMLTQKKKTKKPSGRDYVSTGTTLVNLALSGRWNRGFAKGNYYFLVGDSRSGKTFLALTGLAEAANNPRFKDYRLIYDNVEGGALMDMSHFFGEKMASRLESPGKNKNGEPQNSEIIEEFYYHLDDVVADGRPFIYILDSMDGLSSNAEQKKFDEQKNAHRKGNKAKGAYTDGKAKINSSGIRQMLADIRSSGSILIVIGQTRADMNTGYKTRSGGKSLRFYATCEVWSSVGKPIKRTVKGKERQIGNTSIFKVQKNRDTGRQPQVEVPIYPYSGFDDVGSCVNFLLDEGHWNKPKGASKFKAPEFDFEGTDSALIQMIEEKGAERDIALIVQEVWNAIDEACNPRRKRRYE